MRGIMAKKQIKPTLLEYFSNAEITSAIKTLADKQRELDKITSDKNAQIAEISKELEELTTPIQKEVDLILESIRNYCDTHKEEYFGEERSVDFVTGVCSYRLKPTSVKSKLTEKLLTKLLGNPENKINSLLSKVKSMLSKYFIRFSLELDKQAALKDVKAAKELGIEFDEGGDLFYINPFEYEGEFKV